MRTDERPVANADASSDAFAAMEFGLALDRQDIDTNSFDVCLAQAAEMIGGEVLFDIPADGSVPDASRIGAIRVPFGESERIVFAILDAEGETLRAAGREEIGERFYGFARAFVGVLTRIRDDLTIGRPGGQASAAA